MTKLCLQLYASCIPRSEFIIYTIQGVSKVLKFSWKVLLIKKLLLQIRSTRYNVGMYSMSSISWSQHKNDEQFPDRWIGRSNSRRQNHFPDLTPWLFRMGVHKIEGFCSEDLHSLINNEQLMHLPQITPHMFIDSFALQKKGESMLRLTGQPHWNGLTVPCTYLKLICYLSQAVFRKMSRDYFWNILYNTNRKKYICNTFLWNTTEILFGR